MLRALLYFFTVSYVFITLSPALAVTSQNLSSVANLNPHSQLTSPEAFLGYPLGKWHLRHDQINYYLKQLAGESDRLSIEKSGQSYEHRQQLTLVITSKSNQANLKDILAQRKEAKSGKKQHGPLVIWLAYSIHGDEASGAHAALALSYQLANSNVAWVKKLLDEAIVLITPTQNPDGFDRFSNWTNNYRGQVEVSDPQHKEHKQNWPTGRTNHYFADLNRDWLFLRHPESRGRVALFHKWQPHYVGDFHEMSSNNSYFFQPGVPERTHSLTPEKNQLLTEKLAQFHRQALDKKQQEYFSRQIFDDYFYGKGSTYPDINGSIGVLFEQASPKGQTLMTENGKLRLSDAIDNHLTTSISSLRGSLALKRELLDYQSQFYKDKDKTQKKGRQLGYLIGTLNNAGRIKDLADLFKQHNIEFYYLKKETTKGNKKFSVNSSLFIPLNQAQKSLLIAMFDSRNEFVDPTFYDVSSWNLEHAYHLDMIRDAKLDLSDLSPQAPNNDKFEADRQAVALLINWQQDEAAPVLQQLLKDKVQVKFAAIPFTVKIDNKEHDFPAGSLQIPLKQANVSSEMIKAKITSLMTQTPLNITAVNSSTAVTGIDLGSPDFHSIKPIKPLIVTGYGVDESEAGELWYYLDTKLGSPVTLVDVTRLSRLPLNEYTHVILPDGHYSSLDEVFARKLGLFINKGGIVIAQNGALSWLNKVHLLKAELKEPRFFKLLFDSSDLTFGEKEKLTARQSIGGAILELTLDSSHPLSFGIPNARLPILKNKALGLEDSAMPFSVVAKYAEQPLLNGYLAKEYQRSLSQSPAILVEPRGKGAVVVIADNLMFRNIWLGSEKVYANALYFIPALH
ncbi:peptidase M14 [Shewanella sp. D64]|uniref:M14 family zinc carboxypeptidase n=1 Tax=unclassified Shewanella TaxID=196818 RepID=UPI0022BA29BC|nr:MULTISPECIES: M14 family zinc carboxypeptidase [unclassified Shewanella]MEC4727970.1 peptidase M14 [Shewanella sp. D64]MEC4740058.1 peptidase M14 [Shewanella sp. E94]WBJ95828.1 peptidase M14 [Shewanella sp. MTB7]